MSKRRAKRGAGDDDERVSHGRIGCGNVYGDIIFLLQVLVEELGDSNGEVRLLPIKLADDLWSRAHTAGDSVKKRWDKIKKEGKGHDWLCSKDDLTHHMAVLQGRMRRGVVSYSAQGVFHYDAAGADGSGRKSYIVCKNTTCEPGRARAAKRRAPSPPPPSAQPPSPPPVTPVRVPRPPPPQTCPEEEAIRLEDFHLSPDDCAIEDLLEMCAWEQNQIEPSKRKKQNRGRLVKRLLLVAFAHFQIDPKKYYGEMKRRREAIDQAYTQTSSSTTLDALYWQHFGSNSSRSSSSGGGGGSGPSMKPHLSFAQRLIVITSKLKPVTLEHRGGVRPMRQPDLGGTESAIPVDRNNPQCVRLSQAQTDKPAAPRSFEAWEKGDVSVRDPKFVRTPPPKALLLKLPTLPPALATSSGQGVVELRAAAKAIPDTALHPEAQTRAQAQFRAAETMCERIRSKTKKGRSAVMKMHGTFISAYGSVAGQQWEKDAELAKKHTKKESEQMWTHLQRENLPLRPQSFDSTRLIVCELGTLTEFGDTMVEHERSGCSGMFRIDRIVAQKLGSAHVRIRCSRGVNCLCHGNNQGRTRIEFSTDVEIKMGKKGSTRKFKRVEVKLTVACHLRGWLDAKANAMLNDLGLHLNRSHQIEIVHALTHAVNTYGEEETQLLVSYHKKNDGSDGNGIDQVQNIDACHESGRDSESATAGMIEAKSHEVLTITTQGRAFLDKDKKIKAPAQRMEDSCTQELLEDVKDVSIMRIAHDARPKTDKLIAKFDNPHVFGSTKKKKESKNDSWHFKRNKRNKFGDELAKTEVYKEATTLNPQKCSSKMLALLGPHAAAQFTTQDERDAQKAKWELALKKKQQEQRKALQDMLVQTGRIEFKVVADQLPAAAPDAAAAAEQAAAQAAQQVAQQAADGPLYAVGDDVEVEYDVEGWCVGKVKEVSGTRGNWKYVVAFEGDDDEDDINEKEIRSVELEEAEAPVALEAVPDDDDGLGNPTAPPAGDADEEDAPAAPAADDDALDGGGGAAAAATLTIPQSTLMSEAKKKCKVGQTYSIVAETVCAQDLSDAVLIVVLNEAAERHIYNLKAGKLCDDFIAQHKDEKDRKKARKDLGRAVDDIVRGGPLNGERYYISRTDAGTACMASARACASSSTSTQQPDPVVFLLDAATFNSAIETKIVRQYYERCDYFVLDFSDKRKRTRGRYHLLVLRRWMNTHTYTRTLTIKQKFSAHLSFCMDCGKYDTGEKMHAAIFNFFEHVLGDHTNCAATCSHAEVEPWQKNPTYKQQVSALKVHMLGKIRTKECARIVGGSKTAVIEALWAHMLTYRPKNIHFSLEGCKARCQCCRLDNNARRDPCAVCAKHAPLGWEGEKRRRFAWREELMRRHLFVQPPPALCTRSSGAKS